MIHYLYLLILDALRPINQDWLNRSISRMVSDPPNLKIIEKPARPDGFWPGSLPNR